MWLSKSINDRLFPVLPISLLAGMQTKMNDQIGRLDETKLLLKSSFRTMAIFEFFADIQRPAQLTEISSALKIPQSSTSAIISSLVDTGYLTKNPNTRAYSPSLRINYLNAWRGERHPFACRFNEELKALHRQSGETAVLAMRNSIYSQYILVQHSHDILRQHVETGSVRPLVCSATGWSMLMNESNIEIQKLINMTHLSVKNPLWKETTKTAIRHIETVRENGYAWSAGEAANGASGLAIAIPNGDAPAQFSIAIAGPSKRMDDKKDVVLELLREFVSQIPHSFTHDVLSGDY